MVPAMKENTKKVGNMEWGNSNLLMNMNISDNGIWENKKEKENIIIRMEKRERAFGKKGNELNGWTE